MLQRRYRADGARAPATAAAQPGVGTLGRVFAHHLKSGSQVSDEGRAPGRRSSAITAAAGSGVHSCTLLRRHAWPQPHAAAASRDVVAEGVAACVTATHPAPGPHSRSTSSRRPVLAQYSMGHLTGSSSVSASRRTHITAHAAAAAADGAGADESLGAPGPSSGRPLLVTLQENYRKFMALSGKFMPMVGLFFLLAFVNTILDSLKDTLVITAVGGGAQVIPYLTVYAVLPSSLAFLVAYSFASQRFSRPKLFNGIVAAFMAFFVAFAFVLYPNHHVLHSHPVSDNLAKLLPQGLEGLVGMLRNWTFTAFFCMSELWGDVCLGLLFWGLANDTTKLTDAPTLYPLFGLGANVAQALAGSLLKFFSSGSNAKAEAAAAAGQLAAVDFSSEIQGLMVVVVGFMVAALALHGHIDRQHALRRKREAAEARAAEAAEQAARWQAAGASGNGAAAVSAVDRERRESHASASSSSSSPYASHLSQSSHAGGAAAAVGAAHADQSAMPQHEQQPHHHRRRRRQKKQKPSVGEIFAMLAASVPIRCLAIMSLAQGLCTSLMEFAWKSHIGLLFPSPGQFTAFLGDVSMWQGVVTGFLMILSPAMFARMGWSGVAGATPRILLWGGGAFFAACLTYQFAFASHATEALRLTASAVANAAGTACGQSAASFINGGVGGLVLQVLVYGGALLYVFSKSAKFSLFKPAEEMVYISLDEEGRTKGKAAIDVVGSQAGKSTGSMLQQMLLLVSGGAIAGILPVLAVCYFAMAQGWITAVTTLSRHAQYGHRGTHEDLGSFSSTDSMASTDEAPASPPPSHTASSSSGGGGSAGNGHGGNGSNGHFVHVPEHAGVASSSNGGGHVVQEPAMALPAVVALVSSHVGGVNGGGINGVRLNGGGLGFHSVGASSSHGGVRGVAVLRAQSPVQPVVQDPGLQPLSP